MKKVSIITASYNSEATIKETIESVNIQTYPNIEHIFIDGSSTDKTLSIINSKSKRKKLVISEKDNGIYDAMNKGIELASGDIIGILNSDDIYANKNIISKIIAEFNLKNVDSLFGDLIYTKTNDLKYITRFWKSGNFKKNKFLFGWMPPHPTFFVKKSIYLKFGLFNLSFETASDYELMLRLLYKENISTTYMSEVLVKMRSGGKSNKSLYSWLKGNMEDRKAWKINGLRPYFFTLFLKPLRKITQFVKDQK
tara:strand:+ start:4211 stop:4969 length:759 start_codon:yes stop_codon:yes gene_type:complete